MAEQPSHRDRSGLRKAAIVLAMLDTETAIRVCSELDAETVYEIASEIARLTTVTAAEQEAALREFVGLLEGRQVIDGRGKARELLRTVLGREPETAFLEDAQSTRYLERLRELEPSTIYHYLQGELPQTVAVILSYLPPNRVASILEMANEEYRTDIVYRMATMNPLAPGAVEALAEGALEMTRSVITSRGEQEGVTPRFIAEVISNLPASTIRSILEELKSRSPDVGNQVDELIFTFEDVLNLDDRGLQLVIRSVDERTLAVAMKKLPDNVKERILSNMSSRAREILEQEIALLGPVRVKEVTAARQQIASAARALAERGEIVLSKEQEEYV
jgi:flagellar motor switch protein FliG